MPQRVRLNRADRRPMFLSDKVKKVLPTVDVPNGCVYPEGQAGDHGPEYFVQGTGGGTYSVGSWPNGYRAPRQRRNTFGDNRSGE
jgi:hypothetical protein